MKRRQTAGERKRHLILRRFETAVRKHERAGGYAADERVYRLDPVSPQRREYDAALADVLAALGEA